MILNKKLLIIGVAVLIPSLTAGSLVLGETFEEEIAVLSPTPTPEPTLQPTTEPTEAPVAIPTVKYIPPITVAPTVVIAPTSKLEEAQSKCTTEGNKVSCTINGTAETRSNSDGSKTVTVENANITPGPNTIHVNVNP